MIPQPPKLENLSAGTKLIAGMGTSTILPDFDFETYSEAGFLWRAADGKFEAPPNAPKKGLPSIGAAVYSEHHSTEVLSCAYDLKDGKGKRLWKPGDLPPFELFQHLARGGLLEAWNIAFERWIWVNVCQRKYGWPPLPFDQLRCAKAKSHAFAIPGGLDAAGNIMNIQNKKNKDGKRLLDKFSMPRNPTKNDLRKRIKPVDDPIDANLLYQYNLQDIAAEAELSSLMPDLTEHELEFWLCDQRINFRGVQLDQYAIINCIAIVEQAHERYNDEIVRITRGRVGAASEIQKIRAWMMEYGVHAPTLGAEDVTQLLKIESLPEDVRRVLEIREMIGSASVKKLYAMMNQSTQKGRVHDIFVFHSARTGRAAGAGPQPQNLPNSGPIVSKCIRCQKHFNKDLLLCPWCGSYSTREQVEWNPKAVEDALETIAPGNLDCVEYFWGKNAITIISGCLRGLFIAAPGKDLICSDYSAIEAVVLAALSGESWRMEVFNTHGKIYEMSASKITGIPFDDFIRHKEETGQHHPARKKVGKVAELACISGSTLVLTDKGYIRIKDATSEYKLWDGEKWVNHQGVICKGKKKIIIVDGVRMTPNHPISLGDSWTAAKKLVSNADTLSRALEICSGSLPSLDSEILNLKLKYGLDVLVALLNTKCAFLTYVREKVHVVINALKLKVIERTILNIIGLMKTASQIKNIGGDYLIGFLLRLGGVITLNKNNSIAMVVGELRSHKPGAMIAENSSNTLSRWRVGIIPNLKWIVSTLIKAMNLVTLGSLVVKKTRSIKEKLMTLKNRLRNYENVYDIVNAGNLHRFTIKTNSGHLIVHNSGYQGWIGAWKQFGADEFFTDDEMKKAILAWRAASPSIVEMWGGQIKDWYPNFYGLEGAAVQAVLNPGKPYAFRGITYIVNRDVLYCQLLSGRYLTYHKPRVYPSSRKQDTVSLSFEGWNTNPKYGSIGWVRMETYGGKLTENVVQATARDILAYAIVNLEKAGYPVVLHVHDEIVSEVPENFGSVAEFEQIMSKLPDWAATWPVKANGGWRGKRYTK